MGKRARFNGAFCIRNKINFYFIPVKLRSSYDSTTNATFWLPFHRLRLTSRSQFRFMSGMCIATLAFSAITVTVSCGTFDK